AKKRKGLKKHAPDSPINTAAKVATIEEQNVEPIFTDKPALQTPTRTTSPKVASPKLKVATPKQRREDGEIKGRIGSFPHPFVERPSPLSDRRHHGILNLISMLLVAWLLVQMVTDYKRTGSFLDLTLAEALLSGFPAMLVLSGCVIAGCAIMSIILETFMLINIDIKQTEINKKTTKKDVVTDIILCCSYVVAQFCVWFFSSWFATHLNMSPLCRGATCAQTFVMSMKMHSYFITNRYMRKHFHSNDNIHVVKDRFSNIAKQSVTKSVIHLTLDYINFVMSPTLVYEPNFPRTERIQWFEMIKQLLGFLICCLIIYVSMQKLMIPTMESLSYNVLEHVFYLAVPTMLLWMLAFYGIFHCLLNAVAEVSRFADREFYLEWWDSTTMTEFWKLWNRAVYKWMCRHVYMESMRQVPLFNKKLAAISTYVTTAILHEYLLCIAFVTFRPWFFGLIVLQIPFLYAVERFKGTRLGNMIMWLGFSAGLPIIELFYCYGYMKKNNVDILDPLGKNNSTQEDSVLQYVTF
ncbi:hypothetical protein AKO1_014702, partial [Acrasis kona]